MSSPRRQLPSSDEVLVEQLKTADWRPALAELWERNLPVFWGVARNSTRSDDDASDVLSEVFTQLAERADRGELVVASSFRAYVIRAVRNRATTLGGRRDREAPTDFDATSEPPVLVEQDRFTLSADNALVAEAFAALPEPSRNVLWLSEVEGLPPREVAEVLATTPNNAAQLASRARSSFRESWIRLHLSLKDVATGCEPFAVELPAYLGGKLSATRTSSLEGHLEGCIHCRGLAADLSDDMRPLRALAVPVPIGVAGLAAGRLLLDADTAHAASLSEPALPGSGPPEASSTTPGGGDEIAVSGLPDPPGGVGSTSRPPEPGSGVGALSGTASKGVVALVSVGLLAAAIAGVAIWRTVDGRGEPGSTETAQIESSGSAGPAGEQAEPGPTGAFPLVRVFGPEDLGVPAPDFSGQPAIECDEERCRITGDLDGLSGPLEFPNASGTYELEATLSGGHVYETCRFPQDVTSDDGSINLEFSGGFLSWDWRPGATDCQSQVPPVLAEEIESVKVCTFQHLSPEVMAASTWGSTHRHVEATDLPVKVDVSYFPEDALANVWVWIGCDDYPLGNSGFPEGGGSIDGFAMSQYSTG